LSSHTGLTLLTIPEMHPCNIVMIKTLIMGAAGRDFHNFNTFFRGNKDYEVVALPLPRFPTSKAASTRPNWLVTCTRGIPIRAEEELTELIKQHMVEQVIFAYSDVPHEYVMHKASPSTPWARISA
jgi:predicted GTPase